MLFHLAYVNMVGSFLPTVVKTGAKLVFGINVGRKLARSSTTDVNVVFTPEELTRFRKSCDVEEIKKIHSTAASRNEGDERCPKCGHVQTSLLFHAFNGQMILTNDEWNELEQTKSADRFRLLIGLGRRNAADWRAVYKDAIVGFKTCSCGASTSAKTAEKAA